MDGKNVIIGIALIIIAVFGYNAYVGTGSTAPAPTPSGAGGDAPTPQGKQCGTTPQVDLTADDKYSSGQTNWGTWKYIINGGSPQTDSDGSFSMDINQPLNVLVANGNSSTFYQSIWTPITDSCTVNSENYPSVIAASHYAIKCTNDIGQPINGTTYAANYANYTIGTGGSLTSVCTMTGVAKTGFPHGAVLFLEMNSSTYQEGITGVTWNGQVLGDAGSYGAFSLGMATGQVKTFDVPATEFAVGSVPSFTVSAQAETSIDPAGDYTSMTAYGDAIIGYLIPKNGYVEEDVSPSQFRVGLVDMDNTFTSPYGTTKDTAQIATFAINVQ